MKAPRLLDSASADILRLDWLAAALAPVSPYGQRRFSELRPFEFGEETEAEARAKHVAAVAAAVDDERFDALRAGLRALPDVAAAVATVAIGGVLDDPAFLELHRFCEIVTRIDALVAGLPAVKTVGNDGVAAVGTSLARGARDGGFYLADAFDDELSIARERLSREQAEFDASRGREIEATARELGRDAIESDEFIVMRSSLSATLPPGVRVVREAPTYLLCRVEYGERTLAALERRDAAAAAVAAAEEGVRERLSALAAEHASALHAAARALGELDVLIAAARFTAIHRCTAATVVAEPMVLFEEARFLPLEAELRAAGRDFVALDLELRDAVVLTGPNMGGKSVTLATCGFVALCVAFGVPAPARRASSGLFDQIAWLGMGPRAEVGGLLSSFAREVLELKSVLERGSPRLLMLADEFARTTTPQEGRALLVALVARLRELRACGIIATHLAGIAQAAGVAHFAVRGLREIPRRAAHGNVEDALASLAAAMDYRIAEVGGDERARADAIALAQLLGVDDAFVEAAYRALAQ